MSSRSPRTTELVVVGVGAALGALARAAAGAAWPATGHGLPVTTLLVNLLGCLLIGLLTPLLRRRHPLLGLGTTTGVLGGFTTFSTFAVDVERLARPEPVTMVGYLLLTALGCVLAATIGLVLGERLLTRPEPEVHRSPHRRPVRGGRRPR